MTRIIFLFAGFSLFLAAAPALAHSYPWTPIVTCTENCTLCDLFHTAQHLINFIVWTLGLPVVVIALLIGGVLLMVSGGNEALFQKGKNTLLAAAIGFVIIFGAWIVINTIIVVLNYGASINLQNWWRIECR
jgi:hypothetical protein